MTPLRRLLIAIALEIFTTSLTWAGNFGLGMANAVKKKVQDLDNTISQSTSTTTPLPPGFYVSATGNDNNPGSLAAPFATLGRAQIAMRAGSTKITYIRGGNYFPAAVSESGDTTALYLTNGDDGETWSYYPPDGYDTAIFDGGATSGTTGIQNGIWIDGANSITINGLQFQHFAFTGILIHGGEGGGIFAAYYPYSVPLANGNIIMNNIVHDTFGAFQILINQAGINAEGQVKNTVVSHNVVYNTAGMGIRVSADNNSNLLGTITGTLITGNVVYNTSNNWDDSGAIYTQDPFARSSNIKIINNFIRDYGAVGFYRTTQILYHSTHGIYLDDGTSGAIVSGNVITGRGTTAEFTNGGQNNVFSGNIVDLGPQGNQYIGLLIYDGSTMVVNNSYTGNIILFGSLTDNTFDNGITSWPSTYDSCVNGGNPPPPPGFLYITFTVKNNVYYNYTGGPVQYNGGGCRPNSLGTDSNPIIENPQIFGWTYSIAKNSPVYNSPVNFPPIIGGWGPPGYSIPESGTPPSSPH